MLHACSGTNLETDTVVESTADIHVRPFNFDFPDDLDPVWIPDEPCRSQFFNGVSLTMPYLEPYLVKTMREAMADVEDDALLADMQAFNGQEAQHYRCHRRLNVLLTKNGNPQFAGVEERLRRSYERLQKRSLRTRMAYSAGFECMTNGFTHWLTSKRVELFGGAEPQVTSFWLMHMVEEAEHKTVAFDAYQACFGNYWPRVFGVFHGSAHVIGYGFVGMVSALRRSGELRKLRTLGRLARLLGSMTWEVGPYLLRALLPGYNPRQEQEAGWVDEWIQRYAEVEAKLESVGGDDKASRFALVVDTSDGEMRVSAH